MVGGNWMDTDGLYRQYGTTKAVPEVGGDFLSYGELRVQEYTVDLTLLSATPLIVSNTTFIPLGVYVEEVNLDVEVAPTGASTLSIGLIGNDRTTVSSNTAFVATATVGAQGTKTIINGGSTAVGTQVGTTAGTLVTGYLTATGTATPYTTGKVKVRIKYRTTTTITQ
jgi:hypothetical protein